MYQFEPNEIADKSNDDRLIEDRSQDISISFVNPTGFKDKTYDQQDGNREEELIQEGMDGMYFLGHKLLDIKSGRSPKKACQDL